MEFEAVLEQTIALLQRQGRISYGALKRRFQLFASKASGTG